MRKYFAIFLVALFFFWGVSRLALAITLNTYSFDWQQYAEGLPNFVVQIVFF